MSLISKEQFRAVLLIQGILACFAFAISYSFWSYLCESRLADCLPTNSSVSGILVFALLAMLRPLIFTPTIVLTLVAGHSFDLVTATILTAFGAACSAMLLYFPGKILGIQAVRPWLGANMPSTWEVINQNQLRIIFLMRWLTILPFDLISLLAGILGFKPRWIFLGSFLGVLPEAYMFVSLAQNPSEGAFWSTLMALSLFGVASVVPILIYEIMFRKRGSSLWTFFKRAYYEVVYEVRINNEIIKKREFDNTKTPVILLYGFFSSRKALSIMERLLTQRGFQVMSFNLGGVMGVFFTRGIRDTARHINEKIQRQMERHDFKKVHIVGHSKGGLVALWWLIKLGGDRYCDKVITMGSPFKGTYLTYLGLASPLGFIWRDLWEMRPRSDFLQELKSCEIPKHVDIYNIYSQNDRVAGLGGDFQASNKPPRIVSVPMHHVEHFEFLYRRDVADTLARLLRKPNSSSHKNPRDHPGSKVEPNIESNVESISKPKESNPSDYHQASLAEDQEDFDSNLPGTADAGSKT